MGKYTGYKSQFYVLSVIVRHLLSEIGVLFQPRVIRTRTDCPDSVGPEMILVLSEPKAIIPNRPQCGYNVDCVCYVPGIPCEKNDDGSLKYQWQKFLPGDISDAPPIGSIIQFANNDDLFHGIWSYAKLDATRK